MGEANHQYDDEWEDDTSTEFFDGLTATNNSFASGTTQNTLTDASTRDEEQSAASTQDEAVRDMFGEDIVSLVRATVDSTRKTLQNSLASSGLTGDAADQTKLTIQLKSQGFRELPERAIELLKQDVERLVIANNAISLIPYKFSELQGLTYLNIRSNRLRDFPKSILKLSKLQFLDISRNHLNKLPEEINQLKSLKVLSASGNQLETLPSSLGSLEALRILKIDGNPLNEHYRRLVEECGGSSKGDHQPPLQNQQDLELTLKIKERLRNEAASTDHTGDSSESPLETPRPLRRNNSIRFPVAVHGLSGSESTPDLTSPSSLRAKSHSRGVSGASTYSASRRPGVTPLLINNNDRNRSNSDGLPLSTPAYRTKRVGMLSKRTPDLPLDPNQYRNSMHLRGVSHGSGLKDRPTPTVRSAGRGSLLSGSNGSDDAAAVAAAANDVVVRRLSSLREADNTDLPGFAANEVQGCQDLLYSLHQMHDLIGRQYEVLRRGTPKRSSLERVYYNATSHLVNLDNALVDMYSAAEDEDNVRDDATRNTRDGARSCVVAYKQVIELIYRGVDSYVSETDPRFVRTFLHLLYASTVEAVNATVNLKKMLHEGSRTAPNKAATSTAAAGTTMPGAAAPLSSGRDARPKLTVRSTTPQREKPRSIPSSRYRSDGSGGGFRSTNRFRPSPTPYSAVPSHLGRSRSNSRTMPASASTVPPSTNSSLTGTPRSGESFYMPPTPGLPTPARDYNPMSHIDFNGQDIVFEQVHYSFVQAANAAVPALKELFNRFRNQQRVAIETTGPRARNEYLTRLVTRAKLCQDRCDALRGRLAAVKLKDPDIRRTSEFWSYCTRFVNSFVRLVDEVKTAKGHVLIESDTARILKPVHVAVKVAVAALSNSPWAHVLQTSSPSLVQSRIGSTTGSPAHSRAQSKDAPPPVMAQGSGGAGSGSGSGNHGHHITNSSVDRIRNGGLAAPGQQYPNNSSSNGHNGNSLGIRTRGDSETSLSPYLEQTPLSAALGPAAQATIPNTLAAAAAAVAQQADTPPKTSFDTSFRGDVFERADNLLRSQSVIGHRR